MMWFCEFFKANFSKFNFFLGFKLKNCQNCYRRKYGPSIWRIFQSIFRRVLNNCPWCAAGGNRWSKGRCVQYNFTRSRSSDGMENSKSPRYFDFIWNQINFAVLFRFRSLKIYKPLFRLLGEMLGFRCAP